MSTNVYALIEKTPAYGTVSLDDSVSVVDRTIVIDKPLTIRGGLVREAGILEPIFDVLSGGVTFDNVRIEGSESLATWAPTQEAAYKRAAIRIRGQECMIDRCRINGKSVAVRVEDDRCIVRNGFFRGLFPSGETSPNGANWHQLLSLIGDHHIISGNHLSECGGGVTAGHSTLQTIVCGNTIQGFWDNGIYLSSGSHCVLTSNAIFDGYSGSGIKARGSCNVIEGNTITNSAHLGIALSGRQLSPELNVPSERPVSGHSNICRGNSLYSIGRYGIMLDDHDGGWLYGTQISGNTLSRVGTASTPQSRWSGMLLRGTATMASQNVISEVGRDSYAAIHLWQADDSQAQQNSISNSRVGIMARNSKQIKLDRNYFFHVDQLLDIDKG